MRHYKYVIAKSSHHIASTWREMGIPLDVKITVDWHNATSGYVWGNKPDRKWNVGIYGADGMTPVHTEPTIREEI